MSFKYLHNILVASMLALTMGLAGCEGDDGKDGVGIDGTNCWDLNNNGVGDLPDEDLNGDGVVDVNDCNGLIGSGGSEAEAAIAASKPESCETCHSGAGEEHNAIYERYVDESNLNLSVDSVASADNGDGTFNVVTTFSITGSAFDSIDDLDQFRGYATPYDSATGTYLQSCSLHSGDVAGAGPAFTLTQTCDFAPEAIDGHVYMYIAQTPLFTREGAGSETPEGTHVHLYDDQSNAALAFGAGQEGADGAYDTGANVAGCEKCHGEPYLKHGYRAAEVDGLPDFAACKSCHYDDRNGNHQDWQWMVDDPASWATTALGDDERALYAYKATVLNDTHMSHAMEFPYPMSMYNCASCHEDKLDIVLADEQFTATTCKSCHPVQGIDAWPEFGAEDDPDFMEEGMYYQSARAPALEYIWADAGVSELHTGIDLIATPEACQNCHIENAPALQASVFSDYHTGYDPRISTEDGERYADLYTASVDSVTIDGNLMTVAFSSNTPDIVPELTVSFYGWDSKDMLVSSHTRDGTELCTSRGNPAGCRMEYVPESSGGGANALFAEAEGSGPGAWVVTLDMAAYQAVHTDSIPELIANGDVKKAEVAVAPELEIDGVDVALNAVSDTIDVASGAVVANYFKGENALVSEEKCNVCHDQLAATFHSGSGRGGSIVVCRTCHVTTTGGSHLEMQSRSIDSYIHGVHSFQAFDTDDTFESYDPVFAKRYDQHIKHVFPRFTITNCEACHVSDMVTYNVPDQSKSMPGMLSKSYDVMSWYGIYPEDDPSGLEGLPFETDSRNIGTVAEYVTGPASRACGGCHRARFINQDEAGALASWNSHTESFGTYVPNDEPDDTVVYGVIDKIMSLFQ